jgi:threonine synthase
MVELVSQIKYACSRCGSLAGLVEPVYLCPLCCGNLDVVLDAERVRREHSPASIGAGTDASLWRYAALLPVQVPPLTTAALRSVGGTPLFPVSRLQQHCGLRDVWIKDDSRLPTASFKDRASAVVVARALDQGVTRLITASTGNAGAALAGMAAAAGLEAIILVPESAPPAKIAQLLTFGARLILVKGNYDAAFKLSLQAARELGIYCRSTGYNPFTLEGKKTAAFEIAEQLCASTGEGARGMWTAPDCVVVSVGDGNIIGGVHKGFKELHAIGWIGRVPRMIGVQASGSAAIYNAFAAQSAEIAPVVAHTVADSIAADFPADGLHGLQAATQSGGAYLTVTDAEILAAIPELARFTGVFAEPSCAAAYAGLVKAARSGLVAAQERVVLLITGSGLKDVATATRSVGAPPIIAPTIAELRHALT